MKNATRTLTLAMNKFETDSVGGAKVSIDAIAAINAITVVPIRSNTNADTKIGIKNKLCKDNSKDVSSLGMHHCLLLLKNNAITARVNTNKALYPIFALYLFTSILIISFHYDIYRHYCRYNLPYFRHFMQV